MVYMNNCKWEETINIVANQRSIKVVFTYSKAIVDGLKNYASGSRIVDPFIYGVSTAGNEVITGFQIGGYSQSDNSFMCKLFKFDEMTAICNTNDNFTGQRVHYNPTYKGMRIIYCHV